MDIARKFGPSHLWPMCEQLIHILWGFSSRVSGENGIYKPLVSSYVIVVLSDMITNVSDTITNTSDVITELSVVRIDNYSLK